MPSARDTSAPLPSKCSRTVYLYTSESPDYQLSYILWNKVTDVNKFYDLSMEEFKDRLRKRRTELHLTQDDIARRLKIRQPTVNGWENGRYKPGGGNLQKLATLLQCDADWLISGRGEKQSPARLVVDPSSHGYLGVPVMSAHVVGSAEDSGFEIQYTVDEVETTRYYSRDWVEKQGLNPNCLLRRKVVGSSMEPYLCHGDSVLIHTAEREPMHGKLFEVIVSGNVCIKRLKRLRSEWWITSDNPAYANTDLPMENFSQITGRVREIVRTDDL